jgi:hypothetical protein
VQLLAGLTVQLNDADPLAVPEEAVTVTFEVPAALGVPVIRPVDETDSPGHVAFVPGWPFGLTLARRVFAYAPGLGLPAGDLRMVRLESVLIAVHGALFGLGLGLAWGVAGQKVLILYGITALSIPWTTILAVLVGAGVAGLAAAILPAMKAARTRVLTAIATS